VACDLDQMKAERLYYLRRMNAWTAPSVTSIPERPAAGAKPRRPAPATRIAQADGVRYRLRYTKLGRIAYLGHLDLIRHLPRVFRRAGLEVFYSIGFHPKPELSFGPALGLGIPSLGELLDVKLIDRVPPAELVRRLQAVTLNGIDFLGAASLGDNDRALGRVVAESEFAARLPAGADAEVAAALARFADAQGTPLKIQRHSDHGIGRVVDVRKSLRSVELFEDERVRERLDWPDGAILRFRVAVSHEGSARPSEVLAALFAADVAPRAELADIASRAELARFGLWATDAAGTSIDPLDIESLRRYPAATAVVAPEADGDAAAAPDAAAP
jgi:radical SAM-linked protein